MAWPESTTNIPGEAFGNPTPAQAAFRTAEARRLNPPQARPAFQTGPGQTPGANLVAPTIGGGAPAPAAGANLATPYPEGAASLNPMGGFRKPQPGQNLAPATPGPEVIKGTERLAPGARGGNVHPSWQSFHNAGMGEQYPGAVMAFRRSQGEGALKQQEGEAQRATELEKARIAGQAHVKGMEAYNKDPGRQAVEAEQVAEAKRVREAKIRGEIATRSEQDYKSMHGGSLPKEGEVAYGKHLDAKTYAQDNPEDKGAYKRRYRENDLLEQYDSLFTTENLAAHGLSLPPNISQDAKRALMLEWGPKLLSAAPPEQGGTAMQQLGQIGEHLLPEFMKPKKGVNY